MRAADRPHPDIKWDEWDAMHAKADAIRQRVRAQREREAREAAEREHGWNATRRLIDEQIAIASRLERVAAGSGRIIT